MDSTALLRKMLEAYLYPVKAFVQVPATRPEKFVTVERTGGKIDAFSEQTASAIDSWPMTEPSVADATVESLYDFADPDSRSQRFQLTAHVIVFNTSQPVAAPPPIEEWDHL